MCISYHLFSSWRGCLRFTITLWASSQRWKSSVRWFLHCCVNLSCRFCNNNYKESKENLLNFLNIIIYSGTFFFFFSTSTLPVNEDLERIACCILPPSGSEWSTPAGHFWMESSEKRLNYLNLIYLFLHRKRKPLLIQS